MILDSSIIYKILRDEEWDSFQATCEFRGPPVDLEDGFIHFSTSGQVAETAREHFYDLEEFWLVAVDPTGMTELKREPSRGGALFPHLCGTLSISSVKEYRRISKSNGEFDFH
ncbi:DUF952 domain-containing protein [Thermodesulfobacteriota bacterium]